MEPNPSAKAQGHAANRVDLRELLSRIIWFAWRPGWGIIAVEFVATVANMEFQLNTPEILKLFLQPADTAGKGGFQSLLIRLQNQTDAETGVIRLTDDDLHQIRTYAFEYRTGGWENRLRAIFERHLGPRLDGNRQ